MAFQDNLDKRKTKKLIQHIFSTPQGRQAMTENLFREAHALIESAYETLKEDVMQVDSDIPEKSDYLKKEVEKGVAEILKIKTDEKQKLTSAQQKKISEASTHVYSALEWATLHKLGDLIDKGLRKDIQWNKNMDKVFKHMDL